MKNAVYIGIILIAFAAGTSLGLLLQKKPVRLIDGYDPEVAFTLIRESYQSGFKDAARSFTKGELTEGQPYDQQVQEGTEKYMELIKGAFPPALY